MEIQIIIIKSGDLVVSKDASKIKACRDVAHFHLRSVV